MWVLRLAKDAGDDAIDDAPRACTSVTRERLAGCWRSGPGGRMEVERADTRAACRRPLLPCGRGAGSCDVPLY